MCIKPRNIPSPEQQLVSLWFAQGETCMHTQHNCPRQTLSLPQLGWTWLHSSFPGLKVSKPVCNSHEMASSAFVHHPPFYARYSLPWKLKPSTEGSVQKQQVIDVWFFWNIPAVFMVALALQIMIFQSLPATKTWSRISKWELMTALG